MSDAPTADETAETVARMRHLFDKHGIESDAFEGYVRHAVESGELFPDEYELTVERDIAFRDRIRGEEEVTVGRWLSMGMMLGAALERDVPAHSELDQRFRDGEFVLPSAEVVGDE